jgi:hypothetical protein
MLKVNYEDVMELVDGRIAKNDAAHLRNHVDAVYMLAMEMYPLLNWDVNMDVVVLAIAYHDSACWEDRATHHILGARNLEQDRAELLTLGYTDFEITEAQVAAMSHRNTWKGKRTSMEARLVAIADRGLMFRNLEAAISRSYKYGLSLGVSGEEGMTRAKLKLYKDFGRAAAHRTYDPVVMELFSNEWEEMFCKMETWEFPQ